MTDYIVLRRTEEEDWCVVAQDVKAANAHDAIRITAPRINPADGAYVATPQRSWKPLTVTASTQTILKIT